MVLALGLVAQDMGTQGEPDGLGTTLGLLLLGVPLVPLGVAAAAWWLARRRRTVAAVLPVVLGALGVGALGVAVAVSVVLGALLLAGLAFGAALASPRVAIHSARGDTG